MVASPAVFEGAVAHDVIAHGRRVRVYEKGDGPPLLLLHDIFSDADTWADVAASLAREFRVITLDLPGFGDSEQLPETRFSYDFPSFVDIVLDVAASRGAMRFSLCGHGLGGTIALHIASRHADLVERLVLVSPLVYETQRGLARIGSAPVVGTFFVKQLLGRRLFLTFQRSALRHAGQVPPEERLQAQFSRFSRPSARSSTAATLANTRDLRSSIACVPLVRAPALVVWGATDRVSPLEHGRRIVRELSGARFDVLDAGHTPQEEVPEAFVSSVLAFLKPPLPRASTRPSTSRVSTRPEKKA